MSDSSRQICHERAGCARSVYSARTVRRSTLCLVALFAASCATSARTARRAQPSTVLPEQQTPSAEAPPNLEAPTAIARRSGPRWQCDLEELSLPTLAAELDVPSASIYADAVVGASLIVRERPSRDRTRGSNFDAELHFRNDSGSTDAAKLVLGLPMPGAPWRIEDSRSRVVRRCNAVGECELFAVGVSLLFSHRVREDAPVFALRRIDGARVATAIASMNSRGFAGVARFDGPDRSAGFFARIPEGHAVVGISLDGDALEPLFRRDSDGAIVSMDGALVPLDDRPCAAHAGEPIAVIALPIALGAFGPAIELRAEIARDGAETTCVKRLYGRGTMRLVDSSVEVTVRGPQTTQGFLRTPRAVRGLRCRAE